MASHKKNCAIAVTATAGGLLFFLLPFYQNIGQRLKRHFFTPRGSGIPRRTFWMQVFCCFCCRYCPKNHRLTGAQGQAQGGYTSSYCCSTASAAVNHSQHH